MLMIKAEASAGTDLRESMIPDMVALAARTGARVEVRGNETVFWADPGDTVDAMQAAYDRLYPASRYVATFIKQVAPRRPAAITSPTA
jgi:hypothetical protein